MPKTKAAIVEAEVAEYEEAEETIPVKQAAVKAKEPTLQSAELQRRSLKSTYNSAMKVDVTISPLYRPYFGDSMRVAINGFAVYIPCDGKTRQISKQFAVEAYRRVAAINDFLLKRERRSDVQNNIENSPGELRIV
jgi:hypothetical protein